MDEVRDTFDVSCANFCLTIALSSGYGRRRWRLSLRVGDRGHRIHRRRPRPVRAPRRSTVVGGGGVLDAGERRRRPRKRWAPTGGRLGRGAGSRPGGRRRAHLHAQPPPPAARRGRARRRQARGLREAAGPRRRGRRSGWSPRPPSRAARPPCRSSTASTRRCARRASACAAGETGALHLLHGTYLQDWLLRPEDDNWRVDESLGGASRAFADIGSHWCDLAEFISGQRLTGSRRGR